MEREDFVLIPLVMNEFDTASVERGNDQMEASPSGRQWLKKARQGAACRHWVKPAGNTRRLLELTSETTPISRLKITPRSALLQALVLTAYGSAVYFLLETTDSAQDGVKHPLRTVWA
jgi:hypothetical protein